MVLPVAIRYDSYADRASDFVRSPDWGGLLLDKQRPDALPYDASPATKIARRGVRLLSILTFLTLLNTVMLGIFVLGPHLSPFLKQQWQEWQTTRAQRKQRLAEIAVQNQCLAYAAPADKVVYEEDPDEGARLLSAEAADYEAAVGGRGGFGIPAGWRPPVRVKFPQTFRQFEFSVADLGGGGGGSMPVLYDHEGAMLFLHERTTPAGKRWLVAVRLRYSTDFRIQSTSDGEDTATQQKMRSLVTAVYSVASGADDPSPTVLNEQSLKLLLPDARDHVAARVKREWVEGKAPPGVKQESGGWERRTTTLDYGSRLRVLAGRPDKDDPTHFTIPYRLDGRDGVIDGWLRDDGVRLRPRAGRMTFDDAQQAWDLSAPATGPATEPATEPAPHAAPGPVQ